MSPTERFTRELDEITSAYESGFAGQDRGTRDLGQMDALLLRTSDLLARIDAARAAPPGSAGSAESGDLDSLRETVENSLRLYQAERAAIAEAHAAGPHFQEFARLASLANFIFARYGRHFAQQPRPTRDLGLLDEMIEELQSIRRGMEEVRAACPWEGQGPDLEVVAGNLLTYAAERAEIEKAREGGTTEEQANVLGGLANSQFQLYRDHFAGRSRLTRRPGLLVRMIGNLERVSEAMARLQRQGMHADWHDRNRDVVAANLRMYKSELGEVRALRERTRLTELWGALGEEANGIFAEYERDFADKDRRLVDLGKLGLLADRLGEICRQMLDLRRVDVPESSTEDLDVVVSYLGTFMEEHQLIRQAQRS